MNLFLANSLNISIQLLFAVLVIVSLLLLGVVLMQRPKQEGLGAAFGAAITDQAFGARTTDVLKKATVYFGSAFMILCLVLGMLINRQHVKSSESLLSPEMMKAAAKQEASVPAKTPEELQQEELRRRAAEAEAASSQAPLCRKLPLLSLRKLPLPLIKRMFFLNAPAVLRQPGRLHAGAMRRMFAAPETRFEIGGSGCFPLALNRNCATLGKV